MLGNVNKYGIFSMFCVLCIVQSKSDNATCKGPEACVYDAIFTGYNKLTRPVNHYNKTVEVQLEFVLNKLMDIDEKNEYMKVVGFFKAWWHDDFLKWDPNDYHGVENLNVPADMVWTPDIGITNSVSNFYEVSYQRDFLLRAHYNGDVRWSYGGVTTTSCGVQLKFYPFDEQVCYIEVESWQYDKGQVSIHLFPGKSVNLNTVSHHPQWTLNHAKGESYLKYNNTYSAVKFIFTWSHKSLYFGMNIFLPIAFLAVLSLGVFWLPIESGERVSMGITVVLAFSVFQVLIMELIPVNSDTVPKLTEMVVILMSLAAVSLGSSMFVSYLNDKLHPPPHWMKKAFLHHIPKLLRMSFCKKFEDEFCTYDVHPKLERSDITENRAKRCNLNENIAVTNDKETCSTITHTSQENGSIKIDSKEIGSNRNSPLCMKGKLSIENLGRDVQEILAHLDLMKVKILEEEESKKIKDYWKYIGRAFDRMMFWLCLVSLILYSLYASVTVFL